MSETKLLQGNGAPPVWADIESRRQTSPRERFYVLVDGALNEKLLDDIKQLWPYLEWQSVYENLAESAWPECTPLLLHIDPDRDEAQAQYRYLRSKKRIAPESILLIWSPAETEALAAHLGQYAELKMADDQRAILRFHDPNIWPAVVAVMPPDTLRHFLAPISEVWVPDLDNVWHVYRGDAQEIPPAIKEHAWTAAQQARFADLTVPRKILGTLENEHEDLVTGSRVGWLRTIGAWIEKARALGAQQKGAQSLYCLVALLAGSDFEKDSVVAAELEGIGSRHASFQDAISAVPPETWERLASERAPGQG